MVSRRIGLDWISRADSTVGNIMRMNENVVPLSLSPYFDPSQLAAAEEQSFLLR